MFTMCIVGHSLYLFAVLVSERINSGAGEDITFPKTNELQNISRNESENPVAVTVTGALLDHVYDG